MIRAVFDGTHVTVCGHAGHAPAGQDIVCAAVSALVYALAGSLEETGLASRGCCRRGFAEGEGAGECGAAFALVRCGLAQLARQYPACVQVTGS